MRSFILIIILNLSLFTLTAFENTNSYQNNNDKIIQEIKEVFSKELVSLKKNENHYEYSYFDLDKSLIAVGKYDSHLNSLMKLFEGKYQGEKRLFIVGNQPSTKKYDNSYVAFLLYREPDGENVLLKLRKGDKEWEIVDKMKRK